MYCIAVWPASESNRALSPPSRNDASSCPEIATPTKDRRLALPPDSLQVRSLHEHLGAASDRHIAATNMAAMGPLARPPRLAPRPHRRIHARAAVVRDQAGLGLPVRRADAGFADRDLDVLAGAGAARALRFRHAGRDRHPGRAAEPASRNKA